MANADATFSSAIAQFYDRYFGHGLFGPYAEDIARRADLTSGTLLEVAAGTGIVTSVLARSLPAEVSIMATDLNQPMLDFAATKEGMKRVMWRQTDATALPFPDGSFDMVVCQFGVMFYPDRERGHAEAYRVLKPDGRYIFNVWDSVARNPIFALVHETAANLYPHRPPGFIARTPCGYHDEATILRDVRNAGFAEARIEAVNATWSAASHSDPAMAFCQGSPLRAEIEAADPDGPERATAAVAEAIAAHIGDGSPDFPTCALVIEAKR